MTDKKPEREHITNLLKKRYGLNDIQSTNVLEYAYSLSKQRDKANDFALAHYLNERAMTMFRLVIDNQNKNEIDHENCEWWSNHGRVCCVSDRFGTEFGIVALIATDETYKEPKKESFNGGRNKIFET